MATPGTDPEAILEEKVSGETNRMLLQRDWVALGEWQGSGEACWSVFWGATASAARFILARGWMAVATSRCGRSDQTHGRGVAFSEAARQQGRARAFCRPCCCCCFFPRTACALFVH